MNGNDRRFMGPSGGQLDAPEQERNAQPQSQDENRSATPRVLPARLGFSDPPQTHAESGLRPSQGATNSPRAAREQMMPPSTSGQGSDPANPAWPSADAASRGAAAPGHAVDPGHVAPPAEPYHPYPVAGPPPPSAHPGTLRAPTQYLNRAAQAPYAAPPTAGPGPGNVATDPAQFADEATEVYGDGGGQQAQQIKGRLAVLEGELAGHWFTLLGTEIAIGRADDNHLIVPDLAVSRHHTIMVYGQGSYRLQDLGSGNGTFVNGIRIEEASLRDGDQLEIGRTVMEFLTTQRTPGPVRYRHHEAVPPGQPPQAMPPAQQQAMPPPTPATPPPQTRQPFTGPGAGAQPQPQPQPQPQSQDQQQPFGASLPSMQFPQALSPSQEGFTPMPQPPRRAGMPGWAIMVFSLMGLGVLGMALTIGYHLLVGWGPPEPTPFQMANEAFRAGRWEEALLLMKAVPEDSERIGDAQRATDLLTDNRKLFEEGKALHAREELDAAAEKLQQFSEDDPYAAEAADLLARVEAEIEAREAAKPRGPKVIPGSPIDKALAPYRRERLTQSRHALRRLARKDPMAAELADKMSGLLKALRAGKAHLRRNKHVEAREQFERARTFDLELGGHLQEIILPRLVGILVTQVEQGLKERDFEMVGSGITTLRSIAPNHPKVASLAQTLSKKARELLIEALQLRDVTPQRSKRRLKQVLQIVPPKDPSHIRAKKALSARSRL